jgi:hypothetical protein
MIDRAHPRASSAVLGVGRGYTIDDSATTSGISPLVDQSIAPTTHVYVAITAQASYKATFMSDLLHPNDAGCVVTGRRLVRRSSEQSMLNARDKERS